MLQTILSIDIEINFIKNIHKRLKLKSFSLVTLVRTVTNEKNEK